MSKRKPEHIGIIPDGNRRWAAGKGMRRQDGYEYGLEPGLKLMQMAKANGIKEITYYGFTVDNCKRPAEQFQAFQKACVDAVEMLTKEGADLLVIGDSSSKCFPKELLPYTKRTPVHGGGMRRLSGFLPIQSVYADFYVEEHLWPDYTDEDFMNALEWYGRQDVTLGG